MDQHGNALAQRQVADKSKEIPAFAPLLDTIDLDGAVVTADALHSQHHHARYLRDRGAHYIAVITNLAAGTPSVLAVALLPLVAVLAWGRRDRTIALLRPQ